MSLQDKLYNYEQTPPANIWEKIATALDESNISDEFPSKLYNAEVIPPTTAWDKISASLETETATAAPEKRRFIPFLRYAAAAAVIGILIFGVIKLTSGNSDKPGAESIAGTKDSTRDKPKDAIVNDNNVVENSPEKENVNPEENNNGIASTDIKATGQKRIKNYAITDNMDAMQPIYAFNEHTPNLADRYIMLMTPEGNIIRMSKKLGEFVCCVSGEEQNSDCKDQIKKWQTKLATSPASAGNFMDILSMVSSLSENEL